MAHLFRLFFPSSIIFSSSKIKRFQMLRTNKNVWLDDELTSTSSVVSSFAFLTSDSRALPFSSCVACQPPLASNHMRDAIFIFYLLDVGNVFKSKYMAPRSLTVRIHSWFLRSLSVATKISWWLCPYGWPSDFSRVTLPFPIFPSLFFSKISRLVYLNSTCDSLNSRFSRNFMSNSASSIWILLNILFYISLIEAIDRWFEI